MLHKLNIFLYSRLITILIGYLLIGFLLSLYHASSLIWLFTIVSILYLSWCGTGAIAIVIFLIFMIVGFCIYSISPKLWFENFENFYQFLWFSKLSSFIHSLQNSFFTPTVKVIVWGITFILIWFLGTGLTFYHGFTQSFLLESYNNNSRQVMIFFLLTIISLIGLKIGQILFLQ